MAIQTGVITLNGIKIIECDSSPALGLGLIAPIGSFASAKDGSGFFYKFGVADNGWSSSGGISTIGGLYNYYNLDTSVTGSTTETVLVNLKVTGGDMGANGVLYYESELAKIGALGGASLKSYASTVGTNSIGNTGVPLSSTLLSTYTLSTAPSCPQAFSRKIVNKNSESSNYIFNSAQSGSNIYIASSNNARTLLNLNTANDFWIVITGALVNAADTLIVQSTQLYINKP